MKNLSEKQVLQIVDILKLELSLLKTINAEVVILKELLENEDTLARFTEWIKKNNPIGTLSISDITRYFQEVHQYELEKGDNRYAHETTPVYQ